MPAEGPIREIGRVLRTDGELAIIEIPKASACEGCAAAGVCHSLGGSDLRELKAVNGIQAAPGEQVEVEIDAKAALSAAVWIYAVPTLLMVATAILFHRLVAADWNTERAGIATALATLGSLALFVLVVWLWRRLHPPDTSGYPRVVRRLAG
ncbi:MAG: SoxR reducing system RseC family protein [bacterium]